MINQNDIREKLVGLKGGVKHLWEKFNHKSVKNVYDQADGIVDTDAVKEKGDSSRLGTAEVEEFVPDEKVATAPRTKSIFSDGTNDAQNLVWDNEDASMQDKSYSFDEDTTDADYEFEDDFEFEDESDTGSGQASRYS